MADRSTPTLPTPSADVAELVNRLSAAESALEHSLGPGADAVLDSRGHAHLLRQAQVALQQSEERYRLLFEHAPDVIFAIAPTGAITSLNQAFETITGWPPAQWLGRSFQEFIHPDDQPHAGEMFQLLLRGERAPIFELRVRTAAGGFRDVEFTGFSSQLSGGRIEAQGIGRDITERKQAEEELMKRNAFIESILANAPIGFAVNTISDGQSMFVSRNFEKIYGVPPDSLHNVDDYFEKVYLDPVFREKIRERVMADMATGEASRMRWENIPITTLAGEHRIVIATNIPLLKQNLMISTVQDATEPWQAKEALRASQQVLEGIINAIPIRVFWKDKNLVYLGCNAMFARDAGFANPKDLIGKDDYQMGWRDQADLYRGDDRQVIESGCPKLLIEESLTTPEGTITLLTSKIPLRNLKGEISGVLGTFMDITERKRAEEALRQSESEQRNLAKNLTMAQEVGNVGSWETDFATQEIRWSAQTHRIFETTPDTFTPTHAGFIEFIPPKDREAVNTAFLVSADSRAPCSIEHRIVMRDGRIKHVEERWQTFANAENHSVWAVGTCRDITEHKLAERQLREQNEILINAHEGVMVVNLANQVTLWNHGAEVIFGLTEAEALGRLPEQLFGVTDPGAIATLRAAAERDGFWSGELRAQTRDGRKLVVDCRVTLVRDKAGQPRARLNFLSDITEKKLLEEKYFHAQRLESLGMLAAGIAHDLNNVLAPIMFSAPLLRTSLTTPRDVKILNTLESSASRGAGLVKQILGFAQNNAGERRPTQVKHLARDIIGMIEETFPKSIQLEHHIPADLWPVQGDATQIHQVLLNLCVNARDAMPAGGTLRLTAANRRLAAAECDKIPDSRPGAWLMLEVTDTGTGIAPATLAHIWEPFFTTKGKGQGTGLGLSTVRGIVISHHGFVELLTEVGHGTTFRVYLPALESESPRASEALPAAIPRGRGELILVVDDEASIRDLATNLLAEHGYRVVACADGLEALELFTTRASEFSLILTDVDMPRLGGVALARAALLIRPDIRVIGMSGLSRNQTSGADLPEIRKLAHGFLPKPFKPDELLSTIHGLLHPSTET